MKSNLLKRTLTLCLIAALLCCTVLTGCAGRRSVTPEAFTTACEAAGFTMEDAAESYGSGAVTSVLLCNTATCSMGYFNFTDAATAKTQYAQLYSTLAANTKNAKYIDSAEYNRFFVSDENGLALLYRNGTNLIYITGDADETLSEIIDELGI